MKNCCKNLYKVSRAEQNNMQNGLRDEIFQTGLMAEEKMVKVIFWIVLYPAPA